MSRIWFAGAMALLTACAQTPPAESIAAPPASSANATVEPVSSAEVISALHLRDAWVAKGLHADVRWSRVAGTPVDRIEWQSLNVELPYDAARAAEVASDVGNFAATASHPVLVVLFARSHKQDADITAALKADTPYGSARFKMGAYCLPLLRLFSVGCTPSTWMALRVLLMSRK